MLDVKRLKVLREVARRGSFSAAAESLGYTQPAISRHVALLERETGATLIERRATGVRLTDAGALLVGHADAILARLHDAEEALDELLGLRAGKLRMSTVTSAAATFVPLAIAEFRRRLPEVELSVSMADVSTVLTPLRHGELDLVVCNDARPLEQPDVDGVVLFEEPVLVALPRTHPLASRKRLRLSELSADPWMLGTAAGCPDRKRFVLACREAGFEPDIAFNHDDYTAILGCVEAGVGAAPVPEMVARNTRANVKVFELSGVNLTRPLVALWPAGYQSRPARAMVEMLQEASEEWQRAAPLAPARAA
jgi:DNA-binding transcriptional LysR family regulator